MKPGLPTAWFSCLVRHPARKRSGSILSTPEPAPGPKAVQPIVSTFLHCPYAITEKFLRKIPGPTHSPTHGPIQRHQQEDPGSHHQHRRTVGDNFLTINPALHIIQLNAEGLSATAFAKCKHCSHYTEQ